VAVVRDLDLDHAVDLARVAAGLLEPLLEVRDDRVAVVLVALAGGADVAGGRACGVAGGGGTAAGDVDGDGRRGPVVDGGAEGRVELALELDAVLAPEPVDQPHGLAQAGEALLQLRPLDADDLLVERLAG